MLRLGLPGWIVMIRGLPARNTHQGSIEGSGDNAAINHDRGYNRLLGNLEAESSAAVSIPTTDTPARARRALDTDAYGG